jgi:hypothetical protein
MAEINFFIRGKIIVSGIDFIVLAILSTTAIVIVGWVVKACYTLKKDWRRGPSLLEIKPAPQPIPRQLPKK